MNIARSVNIPYPDIDAHNNNREKSENCQSSLIWWGINLFYITKNKKQKQKLVSLSNDIWEFIKVTSPHWLTVLVTEHSTLCVILPLVPLLVLISFLRGSSVSVCLSFEDENEQSYNAFFSLRKIFNVESLAILWIYYYYHHHYYFCVSPWL